ncbi:hypothetical protein GAS19_11655 [Burkholderia glumae]|uniref:hypothetical protein n=1 Tax=Burkholderia glumae TaxID=337 RepID=UPI0012959155|nr:hypothetical protein [Burkholderia glumae]QGA38205.1 hypothetical protein GAS19_11655 [Burkholderia glumae]
MERFKPGMTCCRVAREHVGLCCERSQQLACAVTALAQRLEAGPAPRFLADVMAAFPDRIGVFLEESQRVEQVDAFITTAALVCAALPTKAERHAFRDQIVGQLNAADLCAFDDRMCSEWRRLRGK